MRSVVDDIRSARMAQLFSVPAVAHVGLLKVEHRVASLLWFMARALLLILVPAVGAVIALAFD